MEHDTEVEQVRRVANLKNELNQQRRNDKVESFLHVPTKRSRIKPKGASDFVAQFAKQGGLGG
eukprot:4994134-Pyramimonas_sp.AAC.1